MTNKNVSIFFALFIGLSATAQTDSGSSLDYRNYRAVEAGGSKVPIDTITPLPELISKLATDWKFVMTGKAYWIGYTDDMYSIAEHGNEAIAPLTDFIDTGHSVKAKEGALYTLHLIGINSTIVGRFIEKFENRNARNALLKYLSDTALHTTVLYLLMRDPWLTDIPHFMAYLELPDRGYSKVLSVLRRYEIYNPPLSQPISGSVFNRPVKIKADDYGIKPIDALVAFQKKFSNYFKVDEEILNSPEWLNSTKGLSVWKSSARSKSVINYFSSDIFSSYDEFSDLYDYSFDGENVTVYGPAKARVIWLNWWKNIPQKEKSRYFVSG